MIKDNKLKKKGEKERALEVEKVYKDLEHYKAKVVDIATTYDLDGLDEKLKSARRTEEWAEKFIEEL